jgi:hypothetical protein
MGCKAYIRRISTRKQATALFVTIDNVQKQKPEANTIIVSNLLIKMHNFL